MNILRGATIGLRTQEYKELNLTMRAEMQELTFAQFSNIKLKAVQFTRGSLGIYTRDYSPKNTLTRKEWRDRRSDGTIPRKPTKRLYMIDGVKRSFKTLYQAYEAYMERAVAFNDATMNDLM